jgi:hypothetical protein
LFGAGSALSIAGARRIGGGSRMHDALFALQITGRSRICSEISLFFGSTRRGATPKQHEAITEIATVV